MNGSSEDLMFLVLQRTGSSTVMVFIEEFRFYNAKFYITRIVHLNPKSAAYGLENEKQQCWSIKI